MLSHPRTNLVSIKLTFDISGVERILSPGYGLILVIDSASAIDEQTTVFRTNVSLNGTPSDIFQGLGFRFYAGPVTVDM